MHTYKLNEYMIRHGERSFQALTMRFLGKDNIHRWTELRDTNPNITENQLINGRIITIPMSWLNEWYNYSMN